jgi:hypothetical protein
MSALILTMALGLAADGLVSAAPPRGTDAPQAATQPVDRPAATQQVAAQPPTSTRQPGTATPPPAATGDAVRPQHEEAASAAYLKAEALRKAGNCPAALDAYQDVIVAYPRLAWAGRAELGTGRCLVALDRIRDAMPHLQRVRRYAAVMSPGEAATAIEWNTILARFYLRGEAPATAPVFAFAGRAGGSTPAPIRDVVAMALVRETPGDGAAVTPPAPAVTPAAPRAAAQSSPLEQLAVLTEQSFLLYGVQGGIVDSVAVIKPRAVTVDAAGHPLIVTDTGLLRPKTPLMPLRVGAAGATPARPLDELTAACVLSDGTIIAADKRARAIHRFDASGSHLGLLTLMNASRLASNDRDEIIALERDGKAIVLLDRQGGVTRRFITRGEDYLFADIVDVAIDDIGHIYALDRAQSVVFIFGRDGKLLTAVRSPEIGEGAFKQATSLAVDALGRLYIYDERQRQVLIYQ